MALSSPHHLPCTSASRCRASSSSSSSFLFFLVVILLSYTSIVAAFSFPKFAKPVIDPHDQVDDAKCTVQSIQDANHEHYFPVVNELAKKTFFRTFKVDLDSECPFWAMQVMCGASGGCSVCKCDEKDIPIPWKITKVDRVNTFLGIGKERPKPWVDVDRDVWFPKPDERKMSYVNLQLNPETNTGYSGREANRVWQAIYTENCFQGGKLEDMCYEERVFYRLLSGLHSSITMKVATYHFKRDAANKHVEHNTYDMFTPNYDMFEYGLAKFPERLKNLYFLYSFMLRAIVKASDVLENFDYNTGNELEDKETQRLVKQLLTLKSAVMVDGDDAATNADSNTVVDASGKQQCKSPVFDESSLFRTSAQDIDAVHFKEQMRDHFRNISMIMDCVACEKCRMWSKLEMLGLATALKIVLADSPAEYSTLQRNEIIALLNAFKQHAQSIEDVGKFNDMRWRREWSPIISYAMVGSIALVVLRLVWILMCHRRQSAAAAGRDQKKLTTESEPATSPKSRKTKKE